MSNSAGALHLERIRVTPPTPYYEDDLVTLYHGKAEDVLPTLAPGSVDVLLTDPPYFNVKDEDWDRQWKKRIHFLDWLGGILDATTPLLSPAPSVWVFAGPHMATAVEREVVEPRLRVLNNIRWVKEAGWHNKAEIEAQRRYLTPWEAVILAERHRDAYEDACDALHHETCAPVGEYIQSERLRAGASRRDVAEGLRGYKNLDSATANVANWELGKNLISEADYEAARAVLNRDGGDHLGREYASLRQQYEALRHQYEEQRRAYEGLRRPFRLSANGPVTDLWTFPAVMGYPGKHPCEKPLSMIRHMLDVSARPTSTVLDPFAGSGSMLRAAKDAGIKAIGIEKDRRWCEHAARRLAQDALDLGGAA